MPVTDLNQTYGKVNERIQSVETYNQVIDGTKQILSQSQSSFEQSTNDTATPADVLSEQQKRFQRQATSQLEKLLDINKLMPDNRFSGFTNTSTGSLVKNQFSEALNKITSILPQIIIDEMLNQLGCSQEQTYDSSVFTNGIFIPVESIDLFGILKEDPTTPLAKLIYEKEKVDVQNNPFSMNKELYNRLQKEGQSYDSQYGQNYLGLSKQKLFNMTYSSTDNFGNNGNFIKVNLINRLNNQNLVSQFMVDYFNTIKLVDKKNIYLQVFQILFGAVSIEIKMGSKQIEDQEFFQKILSRILGLCFDDRSEIDVSGTAKVAPLDGVDDSFFELTNIDIRQIESKLTNIQRGVVEYQDCTNVLLPVDTQSIINNLSEMLNIDENDSAKATEIFNKTIDSVKGNTNWPQIDSIGLKIDNDIIKALPQALISAVLSPKVLLPFMVMWKALESTVLSVVNEVNNLTTFVKTFKKLIIGIMSRVGAEFVKILRNIIVRDVRKLLQSITRDLKKTQTTKKYAIISQLIEGAILLTQLIDDYRKCKSVIGDILNIIEFALRGTSFKIPPFLLPLAELRSGFNTSRASLEVIQNLQKLGIPTGPMPDGSPNTFMIGMKAQIEGVESERDKNSKLQVYVPQTAITPAFITVPVFNATGLAV